jgi:replication-associated recombination protein RarA
MESQPILQQFSTDSPTFAFPKSLADQYRPRTIAGFAGLDKQRRMLANFCKHPRECAFLFYGASGVGKTSMAFAMAAELNAEVHHIGSQECKLDVLQDTVRQCYYVPRGSTVERPTFHVIICDEADAMSDAAQKYLLSKLDAAQPVPGTIWVFTANAIDRLEPRFQSRCMMLEFSTYGMAESVIEYLAKVWIQQGGTEANCPNLKKLVTNTQCNVRAALQSIELTLMAI